MQFQLREVFCFHGAKRTQPHMQGDPGQADTLALQTSQQFITEMQSGRRCCHGTRPIRITRLIPLGIGGIMTVDIGRQWHFTALIKQGFDRLRIPAIQGELHNPPPTGGILMKYPQGDRSALNREQVAWTHALRRARQTEPLPLTTGL